MPAAQECPSMALESSDMLICSKEQQDLQGSHYDAKMTEGQTHHNALGHCADTLVRIIFKILTGVVSFHLE